MGLARVNPRSQFATTALKPLDIQGSDLRFHGVDPFHSFIGLDSSDKAIASAQDNISNLTKAGDHRQVRLFQADLLGSEPLPEPSKTVQARWVIANPPYGERIKIKGNKNEFFEKIFASSEDLAKPQRACFLLPESAHPDRLKSPKGWRRLKILRFSNGGIPVAAVLFVRKSS
jgi:23S rRNA G2445 N2-methylase RlmL